MLNPFKIYRRWKRNNLKERIAYVDSQMSRATKQALIIGAVDAQCLFCPGCSGDEKLRKMLDHQKVLECLVLLVFAIGLRKTILERQLEAIPAD